MNVHEGLQVYRDPGEDQNPLSFDLSQIRHAAHFSAYKYTKDSSERLTYCPYIHSYTSSLLLHITGINKRLTPGLHLPFSSVFCISLLAKDQMSTSEHLVILFAISDSTCLVNLISFALHFANGHLNLSKVCGIFKYQYTNEQCWHTKNILLSTGHEFWQANTHIL